MASFQISITPSRRAAARFIGKVRREILKALAEESASAGLTQSDIARTIGVHRSVINRELRGYKDISVGRIAELAFALGRKPDFALAKVQALAGTNVQMRVVSTPSVSAKTASDTVSLGPPSVRMQSQAA